MQRHDGLLQTPLMKPAEKFCILLEAPCPLSKLIRIRLQVRAVQYAEDEKVIGSEVQDSQSPYHNSSEQKADLERSCQQLCRALNHERPGNLLAAVPDQDPQVCLVVCLKVQILLPKL